MSQDWITSDTGQMVLRLIRDPHPAWLWMGADSQLVWHNAAADRFAATNKSDVFETARPIKGQVKRLLRLGFYGVTSLARVQMIAGQRPISQTCRCTPIKLADGSDALLCVSADAVDMPAGVVMPHADLLLPHLGAYILADEDLRPLSGSRSGLEAVEHGELDAPENGKRTAIGQGIVLVEFDDPSATLADNLVDPAPDGEVSTVAEPVSDSADDDPPAVEVGNEEPAAEASEAPPAGRLANLMESFEAGSNLYSPLGPEDEELPDALRVRSDETDEANVTSEPASEPVEHAEAELADVDVAEPDTTTGTSDPEVPDETPEEESGVENAEAEIPSETPTEHPPESGAQTSKTLWRLTGRGFTPEPAASTPEASGGEIVPLQDGEDINQSARYNFDELARILNERVGQEGERATTTIAPAAAPKESRTLSLSDEHLVLNRLSLGILIFRDQEVVFANRAMADLLACESIAQLRERGLDAIFPRVDAPEVRPGPVATLLDANGAQVPVTAKLQSISWHGGPALMLSARREDASLSGEAAIRSFVQTLAASRGDGFIEISRAGVVDALSGRASDLLQRKSDGVMGRPLALFLNPADVPDFKSFLERPAKRAGSDRPSLVVESSSGAELTLFTEGSAGIVTGYFGLVSAARQLADREKGTSEEPDPALMARTSRGLRRPLNTIIGFAQLIEAEAFGALGNPRYLEYARDIQSAGREIEGLVDELDQYDRLQRGQYIADASDFALDELLSDCETVVRQQAGRRQVFVRSAISETLPQISADRATLRQALLNLLASAIDQTPQGGKVILSAQSEDDGSVSIHVRDSSSGTGELAERFAVFREANGPKTEAMVPLKSSIGLALTRSLLAVNSCSLSMHPSSGTGTLMTLTIPAELVRHQNLRAE